MNSIKLTNINKVYSSGIQAVFDFNLEIKEKEFIALVGPSGCGKSTTLRMIAGLEEISYGELNFDGTVMNAVPSKNRNVAMVFQNYALYPHMSVYQNMAFSLKMRKISNEEIAKKIDWAAKILGLENYLNRKPKDLSGGQRQRVALGRAIVRNPRLFLMDEPLSNLDAKLRAEMRYQIKSLHNRLDATTVYVTHDQVEAMTMADRIVVMSDGFVQQIGTPIELFNSPANIFVAKFIGTPEINLIEGKIEKDTFISNSGDIKITLTGELKERIGNKTTNVVLGIRPQDISDDEVLTTTYKDHIKVKINVIENLGAESIIYSQTKSGDKITFINKSRYSFVHEKEEVEIAFNKSKIILFDKETGINLSSNLNVETKRAIQVISDRKLDYQIKNQLMVQQASKKTLTEKVKIKAIALYSQLKTKIKDKRGSKNDK